MRVDEGANCLTSSFFGVDGHFPVGEEPTEVKGCACVHKLVETCDLKALIHLEGGSQGSNTSEQHRTSNLVAVACLAWRRAAHGLRALQWSCLRAAHDLRAPQWSFLGRSLLAGASSVSKLKPVTSKPSYTWKAVHRAPIPVNSTGQAIWWLWLVWRGAGLLMACGRRSGAACGLLMACGRRNGVASKRTGPERL